ncbi:MAG: Holliday junction resolvase-like protein [Bacteriovoracia bacterium]
MTEKQVALALITHFRRSNYFVECPCCRGEHALNNIDLFYIHDIPTKAKSLIHELRDDLAQRATDLQLWRKNMSKRSEIGARAVNLGFLYEKIAPTLKGFGFNRNDCRSLGDPVDHIIFDGLAETGKVERLIIADVKSGKARLSERQQSIKACLKAKRVKFEVYK